MACGVCAGRRARPRPRRVRGAVRPAADARPARGAAARRGRPRRDRDRVRRAPLGRARAARPRRLRRVPRPDLGPARAEGARAASPTRTPSSPSSSPRRPPRSSRGGSPSTGGSKDAAAWLAERLASLARPLLPARPGAARAGAARAGDRVAAIPRGSPTRCGRSPPSRRRPRPRTWRSSFPPVAQFVERWRSLLRRRSRPRLRPGGGRVLPRRDRRRLPRAARARASSASSPSPRRAPFAPIRITRAAAERSLSWTAHSA